MRRISRFAALYVGALIVLLLAAGAACAQTQWPDLVSYTLSLSSDETARYQTSLALSGPAGENLGLKLEGWWIGGSGDDHAFVGDAYLDYDKEVLYVAAGRKYVPFGPPGIPVGVLVSPGIFGAEVQLRAERVTFQAISGTLQFTPGTGTTRFTFAGNRSPSDESITAARVAGQLTEAGAAVPVTLGVNWVDIADENGSSIDASIGVTEWLTLYGEAADCEGDAHVYGIRLSDANMRNDGTATIFVWYHRDIDVGFVPAALGGSSFFEGQDGWVGGLYHQLDPRRAIGVYVDNEDAILTWFQNMPL